MSELLKCPFCGGEAKIVKYCSKKTIVYVECTNCLAYMGNQRIMTSFSREKEYFESEEKLINAWNTRTPMANIVENIVTSLESEKTVFLGTRTEQTDTILIDDAINIVKQEINNGLE